MPCDVTDEASLDATSRPSKTSGENSTFWFMQSPFRTRTNWTAVSQHVARQLRADDGYFMLLVHRLLSARRAVDEGRRQHDHPVILRGRTCYAPLQRYGCSKSGAGGKRTLPRDRLGPQNIRVNAISAGPIKTLAASGIDNSARPVAGIEIDATAAAAAQRRRRAKFSGSALLPAQAVLGSDVTGEVHHVDAGYGHRRYGQDRSSAADAAAASPGSHRQRGQGR